MTQSNISHMAAATAVADISRPPTVAILPQQQHTQPTMPVVCQQTPPSLLSPMESPRHSIILQPPLPDILQQQPFIFGQVRQNDKVSYMTLK